MEVIYFERIFKKICIDILALHICEFLSGHYRETNGRKVPLFHYIRKVNLPMSINIEE